MKAKPECIPCIMRQVIQASRFSRLSDEDVEEVVRNAMHILLKEKWSKTPPELAHLAHKVVRDKIHGDPYAEVKRKSNEIAMSIYPKLKRKLENVDEPLEYAIKLSIAGNIIDFGAFHDFSLDKIESVVDEITGRNLRYNSYTLFRKKLEKAKNMLIFLDNAGEIVFDRLLIETLQRYYDLDIDLAVKAGPIINDATIEDLKYVGLDKYAREILFISNGEKGYERNSPEVGEWIKEHDLVISKGQGNYEGLSEWNGIFYLLMVKCRVVADALKAEIGDLVFMYL